MFIVYILPVVDAPKIELPAVLVWSLVNMLLVGWANGAPTGFDCRNEVLELLESKHPPPVFSPIEAFCWPINTPLDVEVSAGVPNNEQVPSALKSNKIHPFHLFFYKLTLNNKPLNIGWALVVWQLLPNTGASAVDPKIFVICCVVWFDSDVVCVWLNTASAVGLLPKLHLPNSDVLWALPKNSPDSEPLIFGWT